MTQNFDNSTIAVAKPWCPVCWELLKILRNDTSTNFHVNGYHKTLFQVELPEWLPLEIVVKLTVQFKKILLGQIKRMVKHHKQHETIILAKAEIVSALTLKMVKMMLSRPLSMIAARYPRTIINFTNVQANHSYVFSSSTHILLQLFVN